MSTLDWVPELAVALDELVPLEDGSQADWGDVVGRVGGHRHRGPQLVRRLPRRSFRLALVVALIFLLLTGAATATYLLLQSNGDIVFSNGLKLLVVNPNRPGVRVLASCPARSRDCTTFEPTWSPDGTRIAFLRGTGGPIKRSHFSLYLATAEGRDVRRLGTCGECGAINGGGRLSWSPDGRWIAFSRNSGFTWPSTSLWVVAPAGGRLRRITNCHHSCADLGAAWAPNGHLILFARSTHSPSTSGIYTIRPDGSDLTRILSSGEDLEWSPDGSRIAFDSRDGIVVANAHGSDARLVVIEKGATGPGAPSWSPNGRQLLYVKTPSVRGGRGYRFEIWTINADGSAKTRLYHARCCTTGWGRPIWSPDGRLVAFSSDTGGGTFVINADGTGLKRLSPIAYSELSWQPLPKGRRK